MKIRYFEDTDTLLIELKPGSVAETRDLDENTLLDFDAKGQVQAQVLSLAAPGRARILERLIESFDRDSKMSEAWLDEALRREKEVLSGKVAMVSGRQAVARIRAQLT